MNAIQPNQIKPSNAFNKHDQFIPTVIMTILLWRRFKADTHYL